MNGTISRNPARQNFSTFSYIFTQFSHIFIINAIDFIDTERTDFPFTTRTDVFPAVVVIVGIRIILRHDCHLRLPSYPLERKIIQIDTFQVISRLAVIRRFGTSTVLGTIQELDMVGYNLSSPTFLAILSFITPNLEPALNSDQTALFQIIGAMFGLLLPDNYPNEISFPFPLLIGNGPINRQIEIGYSHTIRSITKFRISG